MPIPLPPTSAAALRLPRAPAPLPPSEFPGGGTDDLPELHSDAMLEANVEDDMANAGVFSDECNLHVGDGVFSTSFALPGYAQREDGRGKSEVIDHQTRTPVEVYMAGSTRGQQYMPSTQPRWPSPDEDPFWDDGRRVVQQESGGIPAVDTSFSPVAGQWGTDPLDGRRPEPGADMMMSVPVGPPPAIITPRPIGASPGALSLGARFNNSPSAPLSGLGSYYRSPVAGTALGGFFDEVAAAPTWQLLLGGLVVGVIAKLGYDALSEPGGLLEDF